MVWIPSEWKRVVGKLQTKLRLLVCKLSATVANEENRLAHMELDGHLESDGTSRGRKDIK